MGWESYNLDQIAHDLVIKYRDQKEALNQAYKMRVTVAYGLERFWGEQLRLEGAKSQYWRDTWTALTEIMAISGIEIPNDDVSQNNTPALKDMADKLWSFPLQHRKISLAILTQLCDSMIWWTQRYKKSGGEDNV